MESQTGFAQAENAGKKKQIRRECFLSEMEGLVPWVRRADMIAPFSPKGERVRPSLGSEKTWRGYFLPP